MAEYCHLDLQNEADRIKLEDSMANLLDTLDSQGDNSLVSKEVYKEAILTYLQNVLNNNTDEHFQINEEQYDDVITILQDISEAYGYNSNTYLSFLGIGTSNVEKQLRREKLIAIKEGTYQDKSKDTDRTTKLEAGNYATNRYDRKFLEKAYGSAAQAMVRAQRYGLLGVVSSILVNRGFIKAQDTRMIGNNGLNHSIRLYQQQLFDDIIGYLKHKFPNNKDIDEHSKLYDYKNGYTTIVVDNSGINSMQYIIDTYGYLFEMDSSQLNRIAQYASSDNATESVLSHYQNSELSNNDILNTYQAWVFLNNFDSLVKSELGDSILVKFDFNSLSAEDKYVIIDKTNNAFTWNNDEEIYLETAVSKLTQKLIETTPLYINGRKTGEFLSFGMFNSVISEIKDLVYNPDSSLLNWAEMRKHEEWGLSGDTEEYVKYLAQEVYHKDEEQITFRDIISSIVHDPMQGFAAVIDILHSMKFESTNLSKDQRVSDKAKKDVIDSLYFGVTRNNFLNRKGEIKSLYSLIPEQSLEDNNYYSYITQLVGSIFKNKFTQCYYDQDLKMFKIRTLSDQSIAKLNRRITDGIRNSNPISLETVESQYTISKDGNYTVSVKDMVDSNILIVPHHPSNDPKEAARFTEIDFYIPIITQDEFGKSISILKVTQDVSNTEGVAEFYIAQVDQSKPTVNYANLKYTKESPLSFGEKQLSAILGTNDKGPGFIEKVLGLNLYNNASYYNAFLKKFPLFGGQSCDYSSVSQELLNLATHVLASRVMASSAQYLYELNSGELSRFRTIAESKSYRDTISAYSQGLGKLKYATGAVYSVMPPQTDWNGEISLINRNIKSGVKAENIITYLAQAKAVAEGITTSTQTKDNDGNGLSNYSLSRLLGSVISQMDIQCTQKNSATNETGLVNNPGLLKGFFKMQEVTINGQSKRTTQMNAAEMTYASFILNFMGGLVQKQGKSSPIGTENKSSICGFLASVNSDKPTIDFLLADLQTQILKNTNIDDVKSSLLKTGKRLKTYAELDIQGIQELISLELGKVYNKIYENIQEDFNVLANNLYQTKTGINFLNDFIIQKLPFANKDYLIQNNIKPLNDNGTLTQEFKDYLASQKRIVDKEGTTGDMFKFQGQFISINDPNNFRLLNAWMKSYGILMDPYYYFNYRDSFKQLKDYFYSKYKKENPQVTDMKAIEKEASKIAQNFIQEVCREYNLTHRRNPIELVDQLHMNNGLVANKTLMDIISRFKNVDQHNQFWEIKNAELIKSLLEENFSYTINIDSNSETKNISSLFMENQKNIDFSNNKLVLATFTYTMANGKSSGPIKLTDKLSIKNLELRMKETGYVDKRTGQIHQPGSEINLLKLASNMYNFGTLEVNSYLQKWNMFDYLFTQEHLLTSVGSHLAHPSKGYVKDSSRTYMEDSLAEEAARFFAQHKRNVSLTASMHEFQKNLLNGIPNQYNIATIEDIKDTLFNLVGKEKGGIKPYDGATFVHPMIVRLENLSLGAEKAGNSKKQFVHFYNQRNANGGIVKTCGFGITNQLAMNPRMANMLKKMMQNVWFDHEGNFVTKNGTFENGESTSIFTNIFGNDIIYDNGIEGVYKDIVYFNPLDQTYYRRIFDTDHCAREEETGFYTFTDIALETEKEINYKGEETGRYLTKGIAASDGRTIKVYVTNEGNFQQFDTSNGKEIISTFVNQQNRNSIDLNTLKSHAAINNNWSLYNGLFKGQYCYDLVPNIDGTEDSYYHYSEISLDNLTAFINNIGYKKNVIKSKINIQDDVWQFAKHSDIHYIVTVGAIKQGAANINDAKTYDDDTPLNYQIINANQIGIQLDKEHHADNEELSMMNQVIQGAAYRGFTSNIAMDMYRALASRVESGIKSQMDEFKKFLQTSDPENFEKTIRGIVLKAIFNCGPKDGNLINNLSRSMMEQIKVNPNLKITDVNLNISFSDASLFSKLNSIVAAFVNRNGIRTKIDGVLSVLNPSVGIKKIHGTHTYEYYQPENQTIITEDIINQSPQLSLFLGRSVPVKLLNEQLNYTNVLTLPNKQLGTASVLMIGGNYIINRNGKYEYYYIRLPRDYHALKNDIDNGYVTEVYENVIDGRELAHYNATFRTTSEGESYFNLYDLDSSRFLFTLKQSPSKGNPSLLDKVNKALENSDDISIFENLFRSNKELLLIYDQIMGTFQNFNNDNLNDQKIIEYEIESLEQLLGIKSDANQGIGAKILCLLDEVRTQKKGQINLQFLLSKVAQNISGFEPLLRREVQSDITTITPDVKVNTKALERKALLEAYKNNPTQELFDKINTLYKRSGEQNNLFWTQQELQVKKNALLDSKHKLNEASKSRFYWASQGNYARVEECTRNRNAYLKEVRDLEKAIREHALNIDKEIDLARKEAANQVYINGTLQEVIKESVNIRPYEIIMPKKFKSIFGLKSFDDVEDIKNDKEFFTRKLIKEYDTSLTNFYTYEFKRVDGRHIYILDRKYLNDPRMAGSLKKVKIFKSEERTENTFTRVQADGQKIYDMYYENKDGQIIEDEIWKDGTQEIIVTSNPEFYRNTIKYASIKINQSLLNDDDYVSHVLSFIESGKESTNSSARRWSNFMEQELQKRSSRQGYKEYLKLVLAKADNNSIERRNNYLRKLGTEIHTSFLKSLEVVAARIPAQNQQSFMPMQVVAFDNVDVNSAYVSDAQIWLQGSDYDVDAVSLAMFSFDNSGNFVHWSKYANKQSLELLNASNLMPFVSGKRLELKRFNEEAINKIIEPHLPKSSSAKNALIANYKDIIKKKEKRNFMEQLEIFERILKGGNGIKLEKGENYGKDKVVADNTTVESIKDLADILRVYSDNGMYDLLSIDTYRDEDSMKKISELREYCNQNNININEVFNSLINFVNDYNTYINRVDDETATLMANNGVINGMWRTTLSPRNLQESQTSVDDTTDPFKEKAATSDQETELSTYTPGNVLNKIKAIIINQVGKECIARCAVGMKGMAAWTTYCNYVLNNGNVLDQRNIRVSSDAELYRFKPEDSGLNQETNYFSLSTLANIFALNSENIDDFELYQKLKEVYQDEDAVIKLSALLSLATDNAKELCLGKLNAGTNMIGMYIYGLSVGIPFNELSRLMMSPLGHTIRSLMEGDTFSKEKGQFSISSVLNYLMIGPSVILRNAKQEVKLNFNKNLSDILQDSIYLKKVIGRTPLINIDFQRLDQTNKVSDLMGRFAHCQTLSLSEKIKILQSLKKKTNLESYLDDTKKLELEQKKLQAEERKTYPNKNNIQEYQSKIKSLKEKIDSYEKSSAVKETEEYNQLIDKMQTYVYQVDTIKYDVDSATGRILTDKPSDLLKIETLSQGAEEMKILGSILSINNGVKTKFGESMAFIRKIEEIISNRFHEMEAKKLRRWYLYGDRSKDQKPKNQMNIRLNFTRFLTDPMYQAKQIRTYEACKHSVNILDVIAKVPHFRADLEAAAMEYTGRKLISAKVRAAEVLGEIGRKIFNATSQKQMAQIYRSCNDLVSDFIRRTWMQERLVYDAKQNASYEHYIPIEPGQCYFNEYNILTKNNTTEVIKVPMCTQQGEATLKYWMENYIIPNLINGREMDGTQSGINSSISNSKFIKGLTPVRTDKNPMRVETTAYSLSINMSPREEIERSILNSYRDSFNQLSGKMYHGKTIQQWFWLYNLITFQGKPGENTLTSIFDDFVIEDQLAQDYYSFEAEFDKNRDIRYGIDITKNDIIRWLSSLQSMFSATQKYIKTENPLKLRREIFEKNNINSWASQEQNSSEDVEMSLDEGDLQNRINAEGPRPYVPMGMDEAIAPYLQYFLRGNYEWTYAEKVGDLHIERNLKNNKVLSLSLQTINGQFASKAIVLSIEDSKKNFSNNIYKLKNIIPEEYIEVLKQESANITDFDSFKDTVRRVMIATANHWYATTTAEGETAIVISSETQQGLEDLLPEGLNDIYSRAITAINIMEQDQGNVIDLSQEQVTAIESKFNSIFGGHPIPQARLLSNGSLINRIDRELIELVFDGILDETITTEAHMFDILTSKDSERAKELENSDGFKDLLKRANMEHRKDLIKYYILGYQNRYTPNSKELPTLDKIPGANSENYIKASLELNQYNGTSKESLFAKLNVNSVKEATIKLNREFRDKNIYIDELPNSVILRIESRPTLRGELDSDFQQITEISEQDFFDDILPDLVRKFGISIEQISQTNPLVKNLNDPNVKAFVLNKNIYLVEGKYDAKVEPIHELMHILLGSIRANQGNRFYEIVNLVEKLPDYEARCKKYINRSHSDINEEIFVEEVSKFFAGTLDARNESIINLLDTATKMKFENEIKYTLDTLLNGKISVQAVPNVLEKPLVYIANIVQSMNATNQYTGSINTQGAALHRIAANIKEDLFSGKIKNYTLDEICV